MGKFCRRVTTAHYYGLITGVSGESEKNLNALWNGDHYERQRDFAFSLISNYNGNVSWRVGDEQTQLNW